MGAAEMEMTSILDNLRARDPETLTWIVQANGAPLMRAARGMGFRCEEAEDLVQEVFATFLDSIDRFEGRSQIRTWLFGILHRKAQEARRKLGKDNLADALDDTFDSRFDSSGAWQTPPQDHGRIYESRELGAAIEGCLDGLTHMQRSAFILREVEGVESTEICKILDVTATNMGVLLFRARIRLRDCLEAKGWGIHGC